MQATKDSTWPRVESTVVPSKRNYDMGTLRPPTKRKLETPEGKMNRKVKRKVQKNILML
jgi:hypothetical protein